MTEQVLTPSCDRKTRYYNTQKNTFGLLPGTDGSCPGATTGEGGCWTAPSGRKNKTCYVCNLMNIYKAIAGILTHNTELLKAADYDEKVAILNKEFTRFRKSEARKDVQNLFYRIHWSGDIFDEEYARALAQAMTLNSDIQFWCYTRSFFAVPILCSVTNLSLYLSLDPVNYVEGIVTYAEYASNHDNMAVAYMASTADIKIYEAKILEELTRRNITNKKVISYATDPKYRPCPADLKKIPKTGACSICGICTNRRPKNVWFKTR